MHRIIYILIVVLVWNCGVTEKSKTERQIITQISFPKNNPNKVILNNKHAFNYKKNGNDFEILNLENETLITGNIFKVNGEWKSLIEFVTLNKKFSNSKIIGRNDLFFTLTKSNVITKDFKLDKEKLIEYIEKHNELK